MPDPGSNAPWSDASYIRVYTTLSRDHPSVWNDPTLLGWYVRLLMRANAAWPGLSEVPRAVPDDVLDRLEAEQVIDRAGDHLYRFHGLDAERNGQRRRGQTGGIVRATSAVRDPLGRFAGAGSSNAGPDAGLSLVPDAGTSSLDVQRSSVTQHNATQDPSKGPALQSSNPPARAPAREGSRIACRDYQGHRDQHRMITGIGWRCLVCESEKAMAEPTFSEKVRDQGGDPF